MNNADYWSRRFKLMEDAIQDKSYDTYVKNLEKQYDAAIREIDKDMRAWYQRFAANNEISYANARKWLTTAELDEFKWTVEEYIEKARENSLSGEWVKELENASARVHVSRLDSLKYQLRQQAELLTQAKIKAATNAAELAYTESYWHSAFEVQKGLGVGWTMQGIDSSRLEKVLSRPWTTDNQTFTARCWTDKVKLVEMVNQELTRMIATGAAPDKAINAIAKQFNTSKSNAGKLVMTESAYFSSAAQQDCFNELGVEEYIIVGTLDKSMCDLCGGMDGKVFKMSEFKVGATAPPFHPWCRCCTAPYFADMEGVGRRFARDPDDEFTYTVPKDMTYKQWKAKQDGNVLDKSVESGIIKSNRISYYDVEFGNNLRTSKLNVGSNRFDGISRSKLKQFEADIANNNYETAAVFNSTGQEIFRHAGTVDAIKFSAEELNNIPIGAVVTHNHPNGSLPSPEDITFLINRDISEIRACNKQGAYVIRKGNSWDGKRYSFKDVMREYWQINNDVGKEYRDIAAKEGKNIFEYLLEVDEKALDRFCNNHGLELSWEEA